MLEVIPNTIWKWNANKSIMWTNMFISAVQMKKIWKTNTCSMMKSEISLQTQIDH